ncbi:MAG: tellurite resistance/C4-dicarboxylate transporter family protein [Mycobacterium leprae]
MAATQSDRGGNLAVRRLHPGYLAMVMATGIISTATQLFNYMWLSNLLLAVGVVAYAVLVVLYLWRLVAYTPDFMADLRAPQKGFAFFTFVAASNVLAIRLEVAHVWAASLPLWYAAIIAWLLLTYVIPANLIFSQVKVPLGKAVNATWLIWVVGTQSVTAATATVVMHEPRYAETLATLGVSFWAFGAMLYLVVISLVMVRLFFHELQPADLAAPYWINMGATAITVIAGGRLLLLPATLKTLLLFRPFITGFCFMLWAWGTWWIPMLVWMGIWRHVIRRFPLEYEPTLWSMVFPLGMYAASSTTFGRATGLTFLVNIARWEVWAAVLAWLLVLLGLAGSWIRRPRT